jgi:hypothetical protein
LKCCYSSEVIQNSNINNKLLSNDEGKLSGEDSEYRARHGSAAVRGQAEVE